MVSLYDAAKGYTRKDITSLPEINLKTLELKEDISKTTGHKYKFFEIDGWNYNVKADVLALIQEIIEQRPMTTKVKVYKDKEGTMKVMPLD